MSPSHSDPSGAPHRASNHTELDEFDAEASGRAELRHFGTNDGSLLLFAPEEEVRVFSVIEQYAPSERPEPECVDSARHLTPRWDAAKVTILAGAAVLVAALSGLIVGTHVPPERSPALPQVRPASMAEAFSLPTSTTAVASMSAQQAEQPRARQVSSPASTGPAGTELWPELDAVRMAFADVEGQDVPFELCDAMVAAVDRVVVRCQGRPRAEWTIDFNRALDRWQVVGAPTP